MHWERIIQAGYPSPALRRLTALVLDPSPTRHDCPGKTDMASTAACFRKKWARAEARSGGGRNRQGAKTPRKGLRAEGALLSSVFVMLSQPNFPSASWRLGVLAVNRPRFRA